MKEIEELLEKYNHFKYEQLRSIQQLPDTKIVTLVVQDDEGEDIHTVTITFSGINASRILENHVLSFLDMGFGITLIKENNLYGFALGSGSTMLHVHNAPLYIVASDIEIQES
ncbi:hypothetical protein LCX93_11870 [Sulfurimonas sp. SWIR-19]|uniref:hypothetical protein n=1 Tax=Sulfurimonas sp. SWIR-19 TaxID=2878390 RepID=UPI001CF5C73D|nr:hypothetical protein [Sulfurimonas sp. SWIR-19]UCN00201.1 hypothetical protein LCX93_11870 [Sulfurimonas sp. SWIR-19]